MINFNAFDNARHHYKESEMPFLTRARKIAKENSSYQGLRILHNTPLTMSTLLKIEVLALGGANLTVSCLSTLPPQKEAVEILRAANVEIQLEHSFKGKYDFHLDCCGELIRIAPPKIGAVELTQTGSRLYKKANLTYPTVSVDDSKIKFLETFFGTGDGFVRALNELYENDICNKNFVIFGGGKVGAGIVYALKKITDTITVIDINKSLSQSRLYKDIKFIAGKDKGKIKEAIKNAHYVVTATGKKGVISEYYNLNKKDFGRAFLTNMGADDEYGKNFTKQDIIFDKKPLNFSISEPTTMKYLDPIFYAHNLGIDLILANRMHKGYNPLPKNISAEILHKWQMIHKEKILAILDSKQSSINYRETLRKSSFRNATYG